MKQEEEWLKKSRSPFLQTENCSIGSPVALMEWHPRIRAGISKDFAVLCGLQRSFSFFWFKHWKEFAAKTLLQWHCIIRIQLGPIQHNFPHYHSQELFCLECEMSKVTLSTWGNFLWVNLQTDGGWVLETDTIHWYSKERNTNLSIQEGSSEDLVCVWAMKYSICFHKTKTESQ